MGNLEGSSAGFPSSPVATRFGWSNAWIHGGGWRGLVCSHCCLSSQGNRSDGNGGCSPIGCSGCGTGLGGSNCSLLHSPVLRPRLGRRRCARRTGERAADPARIALRSPSRHCGDLVSTPEAGFCRPRTSTLSRADSFSKVFTSGRCGCSISASFGLPESSTYFGERTLE